MAYNKFRIEHLQSQLLLPVKKDYWIQTQLEPFIKDDVLVSLLGEAAKNYLGSEKARSEFVIMPVLQALQRRNKDVFTIFSGYEFNIDKSKELNGFCDFILSSPANGFIIEAPAFFIVETKKTNIDDNAIAQCGAELYAAQIFNERKERPQNAIYGCVTSAYSWGFLKLENNILTIDPNYVSLNFSNPYDVLATLQWVLDKSLANKY